MAARSHWVKIDRALDHINALDESIKTWRAKDPYSVREEEGPYVDGRVHIFDTWTLNVTRGALVFHVSEPYPVEWSAYLGDAVHNLRSALDHIAFSLNTKGYADANNGVELPGGDAKRSEFPIIGDTDPRRKPPDVFGGTQVQRKIAHVPPDAARIIEDVQPYKRRREWEADPLWLIYDLDRIDKHRQLLFAAAVNERLDVHHVEIPPSLAYGMVVPGQPLDDGDELAYWVLGGKPPEQQVKYDLDFTFGVALGKGGAGAGRPIVKTLRELRDYVRFKVAFRLDKFC